MNPTTKSWGSQRIKQRKWCKKNGRTTDDGSSASREMAMASYLNIFRRMREVKEDPYTKHALSFEEFDNIPDIVTNKTERE